LLTITIDWLSVTFKRENKREDEFIREYACYPTVTPSNARNGYTSGQTDGSGVQLLWNVDREEMGRHTVFSGSALRFIIEQRGIHMETLLRDCANAGGYITRLDLAKDSRGQAIDLPSIYQSLERQGNTGTARNWTELRSNNGGYTLYVGSRTSEKFIRIYDKAAESQLPNELWQRFEIETKGVVARAISASLLNTANWGDVFDTIARAMVSPLQCSAYQQFFSERNISIALPKIERHSDREKWIGEQVIEAVAKHFIDHPQSEAVDRLRRTLDLIDKQRKV